MSKPAFRKREWRPSSLWITARKVVQYLSLLAFVTLFIGSGKTDWSGSLINLPLRLDPLLILANLLASRAFLAGSALALAVVILSLIFGRAWCGWLCPMGTVLDLFSLKRGRGKRAAPSENWRGVKYVLLLTVLFAALLGNLTLLILDPLTILYRTLTTSILPPLNWVVSASEKLIYPVPFLGGAVAAFDAWVRKLILPSEPAYYRTTLLFASLFLGVIALNLAAERFWCRYLCPLGGMLGIFSKLALFRRQVGKECKGCTLCSNACPTGTIDPARGYASDPSECTMCLDCLAACPRSGITFTPRLSMAEWRQYDPGRRQALLAFGTAVAGVALFRSSALSKREPPHLLRPPGAREVNPDVVELSNCIRCGECLRACPTSGLQSAVTEAGLQGFATPVLVPRLGYCDYSCNACGQVCPVGAIPPLDLDEKRLTVIGKAYIIEHRCIAWSDRQPCVVCEEMCPLPEKAIWLEEAQVQAADGSVFNLQLPHVLRERCIGCGICEYKCPVNGEAAIRVYVPEAALPF